MDIAKMTNGRVKEMSDDELHGIDLHAITCRSCSGYGNCGYKSYRIYRDKVVSICNNRKAIEFKKLGIDV